MAAWTSSGKSWWRPWRSSQPSASGVADFVDGPDGDDDDPQPAGDLDIVSDLGMAALELGVLCDDDDLYPDEILGDVATRLGFGDAFERIVG